MRQKKKDTLMNFFAVFTVKYLQKNNVIRTLLRQNSCECKSSSPCESPKLDKISEKNEERCETYISTTSNPVQSDNEHQLTKLAK